MPNRTPSSNLHFILQGDLIAAYPSSAAPKPEPANRNAIWLVVTVCAVVTLGIVAESALRNANPRQSPSSSPPVNKTTLESTSTNSIPPIRHSTGPTRKPNPHPSEYIVKSGDTLGFIAVRHDCTLRELANVNGFPLSQLPVIRVGQRLIIPKPKP